MRRDAWALCLRRWSFVHRNANDSPAAELDEPTRQFYWKALDILDGNRIRYCVAGAYALAAHAGIVRHTKDLDVFLCRDDLQRAIDVLERAGYATERTHPHWLAKVFGTEDHDGREGAGAFIDLIFRAASGIWTVDEEWVSHAQPGDVVGRTAPICPGEELIWSKAMVMERNRFDGADIAHTLLARGRTLDWDRLLRRARGHAGVLLGHLVFFRYVYPNPDDARNVPDAVLDELLRRMRSEPPPSERVCRGTLLSWEHYLIDVNERGFVDGRLQPWGTLTQAEIDRWTEAPK